MVSRNKQTGNNAELTALEYLKQHGLSLIKQNYYSRFGEIDLIMQDADTIVFVEVKKRELAAHALESITYTKQQKLVKTAKFYLMQHGHDINCRFDAIVLDRQNEITWFKNVITLG